MAGTSLVERMKGAALLDMETYENAEHDTSATLQPAAVVVIHALDFGTGKAIVTAVRGWIPVAFVMAMLGMG